MAVKRKDNRDIPESNKTLNRPEGRPMKNRIGLPDEVRTLYDGEIPPRER